MPQSGNSTDARFTADDGDDSVDVRRTVGTWAIILGVWAVGMASWAVWLGAIGWAVVTLLGT